MKIDKDKPLPDHTKLDYDECCAKLILEELFPERYTELTLADKPDLQGDGVGIEVTIANNNKMEEARNNWVKANNCDNAVQKARYIERMAQLGVHYTGGVQGWPGFAPTFDLTRKAVESKIGKLKKGGYKSFPRYELFDFTDTWYCDSVIDAAKTFLFDEKVSRYFKTVYVLSQGADLHIFETQESQYKNEKIDTIEQSNRNRRARRMVEEGEED